MKSKRSRKCIQKNTLHSVATEAVLTIRYAWILCGHVTTVLIVEWQNCRETKAVLQWDTQPPEVDFLLQESTCASFAEVTLSEWQSGSLTQTLPFLLLSSASDFTHLRIYRLPPKPPLFLTDIFPKMLFMW